MKLRSLRGMKDFLPEQYLLYEYVVNTSFKVAKNYGFEFMSIPILEYTEIFSRILGETSEVVNKEMYTFLNKKGESITLRPEFTAGIMRSIIFNKQYNCLPLRYFSVGPVFRYSRPQAGRYRQFHQINCEYIGISNPYVDAELLKCASDILASLGLSDKLTLEVNSLGCPISRQQYQDKLMEYFSNYFDELSKESQNCFTKKNPLRILDSKDIQDNKICSTAPLISDSYTEDSKKYFKQLIYCLDVLGIKYQINTKLVRGLDYYCHTTFEFKTTELGAQGSVLGGGRYDGLSELMGGPNLPALGFAFGVERLMLLIRNNPLIKTRPVFIVNIEEENISYAFQLASKLRHNNIITIVETVGKINKRIQIANKFNAQYVIFIGIAEIQQDVYTIKNLDEGVEYKKSLQDLLKLLIK